MHSGLKEDGRGWRGNGTLKWKDPVGGWESREQHIAIETDNLLLCIHTITHHGVHLIKPTYKYVKNQHTTHTSLQTIFLAFFQ